MKGRERIDSKSGWAGWPPIAFATATILGAVVCAGCLYTATPAMAGPSTTYPQTADSQPSAAPSPASQPASQGTPSTAPGAARP